MLSSVLAFLSVVAITYAQQQPAVGQQQQQQPVAFTGAPVAGQQPQAGFAPQQAFQQQAPVGQQQPQFQQPFAGQPVAGGFPQQNVTGGAFVPPPSQGPFVGQPSQGPFGQPPQQGQFAQPPAQTQQFLPGQAPPTGPQLAPQQGLQPQQPVGAGQTPPPQTTEKCFKTTEAEKKEIVDIINEAVQANANSQESAQEIEKKLKEKLGGKWVAVTGLEFHAFAPDYKRFCLVLVPNTAAVYVANFE